VALFLLFFQSWRLVLHSVLGTDEEQRPAPRQGTNDHSSDGDHPTMNASTTSSTEADRPDGHWQHQRLTLGHAVAFAALVV
jgi:hypothetical protein